MKKLFIAEIANPRVAIAWNKPNIISDLNNPICSEIIPPKNAPINVATKPNIFTTVPISVFVKPISK